MNDGDKGEAAAECPSGKAYAYPGGHVSEMLTRLSRPGQGRQAFSDWRLL